MKGLARGSPLAVPSTLRPTNAFALGGMGTYGTSSVDVYFEHYAGLNLQRRMVADRARTAAFARAIATVVRPGDVVIDVGTGTGILAMLAAKAGAARVYAVDQSDIAETAAHLVSRNQLKAQITVLKGAAADLHLDERPADVLISEWLGNMAFVEGMLQDVLTVRDRNLRPGGTLIPSAVRVEIAPLDDPTLYVYEGPGYWREPVQGLDFSTLEERELRQGRALQIRIEPPALLAPGQTIVDLNLATETQMTLEDREGTLVFRVKRDGVLNGFGGWFVAELAPGVVLDTGPNEPETHWAQTYMPFKPHAVREGDELSVRYRITQDAEEERHLRLTLSLGEWEQTFLIE